MKKSYWLASLYIAGMLLCGLMYAQDAHPSRGTADVPFDFYIAGNKLPAGQYSFELVAPTYVLLQSKDGKVRQDMYFLQTAVAGKKPESKVIFALRGGKYYLCGVSTWRGKSQITSFTIDPGDVMKDVPLQPVEKEVAKPPASL